MRWFARLANGAVGATLTSLSLVAQAQQSITAAPPQSPEPAPPVQKVEITAASSDYDPRRDDTAAKIVINAEELARYGDVSVVDALRRVPGVTVVSTGRGSDIRMRGLGRGYTQILVNGERAPLGVSLDSLSPEQVERVEVIRSASAEYSTQSVAGTINVVLKKVPKQDQRQLQLGYGGDGKEKTARAVLLLAGRRGSVSYSVTGNLRKTSVHPEQASETSDLEQDGRVVAFRSEALHGRGTLDVLTIVPRVNWSLGGGQVLSFDSFRTVERSEADTRQSVQQALGRPSPYTDLQLGGGTRNASFRSDLLWSGRIGPQMRFEVKVGVQGSSVNEDISYLTLGDAAVPLDYRTLSHHTDDGVLTSGKFWHKVGDSHQFTSGWEASRNRRLQTDEERGDIRPAGSSGGEARSLLGRINRLSLFVQDEWQVIPSWTMYLGLRHEKVDTDITADRRAEIKSTVWSPIVQTLIKFPAYPKDQLRLALSRTYRAPAFGNLIPRLRKREINAPTLPDLEGNPGLQPELAQGVDLTYEHYFDKNALFSLGVSKRRISNYTLNQVSYSPLNRWVSRPVNFGEAETRGLEIELRLPLRLLNPEWKATDLKGSLSRNWSSVNNLMGPGAQIADQIPLTATLAVDHKFSQLTIGGNFSFRKGAWTRTDIDQSLQRWNRRDLDFYGLWKFNASQQLRLSFGNLFGADEIVAQGKQVGALLNRRVLTTSGYVTVRALLEQKF
jgi:outer membrane receptor protein involved in Fe transport